MEVKQGILKVSDKTLGCGMTRSLCQLWEAREIFILLLFYSLALALPEDCRPLKSNQFLFDSLMFPQDTAHSKAF